MTPPSVPGEYGLAANESVGHLGLWLVPLSTMVGGLITGLLVYGLAPEAEGHGTDAVVNAFHRAMGRIRARVPVVKLFASAVTIGSGGAAGREGPIALITGRHCIGLRSEATAFGGGDPVASANRHGCGPVRDLSLFTCVGCSAFAPDHVCIVTPERRPQCGRAYEFIKTGAHYGYDDMTNIHHRQLHCGMNSFGTCSKGEVLDASAGEWSGVNEAAARLTGGRITRVQLHSLEAAPHTGCGCFQMILFKTGEPKPGIGIMERGYKARAPDGRTWRDLHYALGGKQVPGLTGGALSYLLSPRFLAAHGGWESVVWVSPKVAAVAGKNVPPGARGSA